MYRMDDIMNIKDHNKRMTVTYNRTLKKDGIKKALSVLSELKQLNNKPNYISYKELVSRFQYHADNGRRSVSYPISLIREKEYRILIQKGFKLSIVSQYKVICFGIKKEDKSKEKRLVIEW